MTEYRFTRAWCWPRWYHRQWWLNLWGSVTRWWRPRTVVVAVYRELGVIVVDTERWSWRRWRWERQAPPPPPPFSLIRRAPTRRPFDYAALKRWRWERKP